MKYLLLLFPLFLHAQSCTHQLTRTPNGPVAVYKNGQLLKQSGDYTSVNATGTFFPIITPSVWSDQDAMSAVLTRAVPLTFTIPGTPPQTITYFSYALWREDWTCTGVGNGGDPAPPTPVPPFPGCASDGANGISCSGGITAAWVAGPLQSVVDAPVGSVIAFTIMPPPDPPAGAGPNGTSWDSAGIRTVKTADGTLYYLVNVTGNK